MRKSLKADEFIQIAKAGGGLDLSGRKELSTDDLVKIAEAASKSKAKLTISSYNKSTDELIQIASANQGNVVFV